MLENRFDPNKQMRYVVYGRMSTDMQNERSPDQQFDSIRSEIKRKGYPWVEVAVYRDQGFSGKRTDRPAFKKMLADIRAKKIIVDMILVDNWDRFGRNDDSPRIAKKLLNECGVLVLTAHSGFADPNSTCGRAHGFVEQIRSTTENEAKARAVRRGKKDAVLRKQWPGGPPPFGYGLETQFLTVKGRHEVDHSILIPDPTRAGIVVLAFDKATSSNWGANRVAEYLNAHPEIGQDIKPFNASSIGIMLLNSIYVGTYVWDKKETDTIENRRVSVSRPVEEQTIVEDFCKPIVEKSVWDLFQRQHQVRSEKQNKKKKERGDCDKAIVPLAPGMVLKYPITGIARCGVCGLSMRPCGTAEYRDKAGKGHRYVGYRCPASFDGGCSNRVRIPEDWLRPLVIASLLRKWGLGEVDPLTPNSMAIVREVHDLSTAELERIQRHNPSRAALLESELEKLNTQIAGWKASLSNTNLLPLMRSELENDCGAAMVKREAITTQLREEQTRISAFKVNLDFETVVSDLRKLPDILREESPSFLNFHLAMHVRSVDCFPDQTVRITICKLAILSDFEQFIRQFQQHEVTETGSSSIIRGRKRARLEANDVQDEDHCQMDFATNPFRFDGLPEQFFWHEHFKVPLRLSWVEQHAEEVLAKKQGGFSTRMLEAHFGKSKPTILKALKIAFDRIKKAG